MTTEHHIRPEHLHKPSKVLQRQMQPKSYQDNASKEMTTPLCRHCLTNMVKVLTWKAHRRGGRGATDDVFKKVNGAVSVAIIYLQLQAGKSFCQLQFPRIPAAHLRERGQGSRAEGQPSWVNVRFYLWVKYNLWLTCVLQIHISSFSDAFIVAVRYGENHSLKKKQHWAMFSGT